MRTGGQASAYMPAEHSIPQEKSHMTLIVVVAAIAALNSTVP